MVAVWVHLHQQNTILLFVIFVIFCYFTVFSTTLNIVVLLGATLCYLVLFGYISFLVKYF